MGFWTTVGAEAVAGVTVALVVTILAVLGTDRYAARQERLVAARQRNLVAAEDFYRVHGQFFAAWKVWEYHSEWGPTGTARRPPSEERRSQLVADAAAAEGGYESLVVRIALEHDLERRQEVALWCLRCAFKELRYAIRDDRRLTWWRTDNRENATTRNGFREYMAFKTLISEVAQILISDTTSANGRNQPDRAASLKRVTGNGEEFMVDREFTQRRIAQRQSHVAAGLQTSKNWEWVLLTEDLNQGSPQAT
jgi:hypothetical protein